MDTIYCPSTAGIAKIMTVVYGIIFIAGSSINIMTHDGLENWFLFLKVSLLYIGICTIIFAAIKSQRIILNDKQFTLKVFGLVRHKINLNHVQEIRKAKLNGSPIIVIETKNNDSKRIFPVPFLPFEQSWSEILPLLKERCGSHVIGEMKLQRDKGELRTWEE